MMKKFKRVFNWRTSSTLNIELGAGHKVLCLNKYYPLAVNCHDIDLKILVRIVKVAMT
jgi:hypothetical protein